MGRYRAFAGVESRRSVALSLAMMVSVCRWPRSPDSAHLDEPSERQLPGVHRPLDPRIANGGSRSTAADQLLQSKVSKQSDPGVRAAASSDCSWRSEAHAVQNLMTAAAHSKPSAEDVWLLLGRNGAMDRRGTGGRATRSRSGGMARRVGDIMIVRVGRPSRHVTVRCNPKVIVSTSRLLALAATVTESGTELSQPQKTRA